jgi:hypothetical protein
MGRKIGYLECTTIRRPRGGSSWPVFLLGVAVGAGSVIAIGKLTGVF